MEYRKEVIWSKKERNVYIKTTRVTFVVLLKNVDDKRQTKIIFNYFDKNPKTPINWFKDTKSDMY